MTALATIAFLLCLGVLSALVYVTRRPSIGPVPLPRPEPMPDLYAGKHRAVLMGDSR